MEQADLGSPGWMYGLIRLISSLVLSMEIIRLFPAGRTLNKSGCSKLFRACGGFAGKVQGMPLNRLQVMAMKEDGVMERAVLESLEELFVRVG